MSKKKNVLTNIMHFHHDYVYNFQYRDYLQQVFPNKSPQTIKEMIQIVLNEIPRENREVQLDAIINLLSEKEHASDEQGQTSSPENDLNNVQFHYEEHLLDEAAGPSRTISEQELAKYVEQLLNIFPEACPDYVQNLVHTKAKVYTSFNMFIDKMISEEYPKRAQDPKAVFEHLKQMLPNADPSYLERQADALAYQSQQELKKFVEDAIEHNGYPTMENYLKNQREFEEMNQYTTHFNIQTFLKQFPNPEAYFNDPDRKPTLAIADPTNERKLEEEETYALNFLYNHYGYLRKKDIGTVFRMFSKNLMKTCAKLDRLRKAFNVPRKTIPLDEPPKNIPLLQEIAYLKHRKEIRSILKEYNEHYRLAKEEATRNNLLQTCRCCYDEELIPEECYFCKNGCTFCKDCVKAGAEAIIGEGKLDFPCLADCGSEFSIPTLQMVLDSVVFSRMAQRKQMEEVKRANIDGLETCPFCDFATIPPPDDKIFHCLNSECMKESCRECRHVSHIPLRCNEIEYDEDVQMRIYIENKMTEALLRKCWKCNKVFIKESGCNKMTCSCGAKMCYVCGQTVTDYAHFGGEGGTRCPLFTRDLNRFHAEAVIRGATEAKAELGIDRNPNRLKNDPSKNLKEHYAV